MYANNNICFNGERFTQNNSPSPSPSDELTEGAWKSLKNIKADLDDLLMRMQASIKNKNLEQRSE